MLFEVTLNNEKEFMKWILQYGSHAEILEPASARIDLKLQLKQWMSIYQRKDK
ncbi:WCX domain-containing protein [Paenibacillus sp. BAC0078]